MRFTLVWLLLASCALAQEPAPSPPPLDLGDLVEQAKGTSYGVPFREAVGWRTEIPIPEALWLGGRGDELPPEAPFFALERHGELYGFLQGYGSEERDRAT